MRLQSSPPTTPWLHAASARASSVFDEAKGRVKEAAGVLSDQRGLKNHGKVDRATEHHGEVGGAADRAKGVVNPKN